jgi:hypothetical protein
LRRQAALSGYNTGWTKCYGQSHNEARNCDARRTVTVFDPGNKLVNTTGIGM